MPGRWLTIVIPALNEEEAIGSTIQRCLDARERICQAGVEGVEIIVVSDGSTDCTVEIASGFEDVKLIVFDRNQGYGAAIKEGWRQGRGELLAFLDADGTCDPEFFAEMCRTSLDEQCDVVLGSRLGPDSQMPRVRRLGNRIFALLLGFLCGRHVTDTASGMRLVRCQSLKHLYPLPDGLHFTPAMSARALLNDLRVVELPMKYEERIGESKLNVFRDGVRFLRAIWDGVLCYRPEKIFLMGFTCCLLTILVLGAGAAELSLRNRRLEEWMIYRFMCCWVLGSCGLLLLLAAALANRMAAFSTRRRNTAGFWPIMVSSLFRGRILSVLLLSLTATGIGFLWPGMVEFVSTGGITMHWSRLLAGAFSLFAAFQTAVFGVLVQIVSIWKVERLAPERRSPVTTPNHGPAGQQADQQADQQAARPLPAPVGTDFAPDVSSDFTSSPSAW